MAGDENAGLPVKRDGTSRPALAVVGGALAIAVLAAVVAWLAGVRTDFDPWGAVSPTNADGGFVVGVAFALLSALGTGIGLVALVGVAVLALAGAGRRHDAAFVAIAVFGAVILSLPLKSYFGAERPSAPESVANWIHYADVAVAIAAGGAVVVALLTRWRAWVVAGVAVALAAVALETLIAWLIPRTAGFDAFPSGHAMYSVVLASAVVPFAWRIPRARYPILLGSLLYVIGVGVSRVYLHAHLPADVVGGWCAGLAWMVGLRIVWAAAAPSFGATTVAPDGGRGAPSGG